MPHGKVDVVESVLHHVAAKQTMDITDTPGIWMRSYILIMMKLTLSVRLRGNAGWFFFKRYMKKGAARGLAKSGVGLGGMVMTGICIFFCMAGCFFPGSTHQTIIRQCSSFMDRVTMYAKNLCTKSFPTHSKKV